MGLDEALQVAAEGPPPWDELRQVGCNVHWRKKGGNTRDAVAGPRDVTDGQRDERTAQCLCRPPALTGIVKIMAATFNTAHSHHKCLAKSHHAQW